MHSSAEYLDLGELTDVDRVLWGNFQAASPSLASPYFSYAYAAAVNVVRPGVKVLRFYEKDRPAAYWPLRPGPFGTARPIAGPMDDLHGMIAHPAVSISLSKSKVRQHIGGYAFSAVPFNQRRHGLTGHYGDGNQVMDLSDGYDAWLADRSEASSNFRREHRKAEKLLNEETTVIRHDVIDPKSFARLIALKQEAYVRSGHFDIFALEWPQPLLEELLRSGDQNARGILSTLSIDGELAAVTYCMRSLNVMHYWFPAYEAKFAKLKPGLALLFSLAKWASLEGLQELHLGLGDTQYKRQMASWMMPVRCGTLALSPTQQLATEFSAWGTKVEGRNRLLDIPAKYARKYDRAALAGTWRA